MKISDYSMQELYAWDRYRYLVRGFEVCGVSYEMY